MPGESSITETKVSAAAVAANASTSADSQTQLYVDIEERRLKEWANYQRSHRTEEDQDANRAFLDLSIDDVLVGRIVVELFDDEAPHAVAQFRRLVTGAGGVDAVTGTKLDYLNTAVSCVDTEKGVVLMGDLDSHGVVLDAPHDAVLARRHGERGLLTTLSRGAEASSSCFGITLRACPSLDFHQVVFGRVIDGAQSLDKLEALALNAAGRPVNKVRVAFCGVLTGPQPPGVWRASSAG